MITWQWSPFTDLTRDDLYAIMQVRQDVFIVEQDCVYPDADGRDQDAWHLLGWRQQSAGRELVAYLRVLPPGTKYNEAAIGRLLTTAAVRGSGAGRELTAEGLRYTAHEFPDTDIRISAQLYLERFYRSFGFEAVTKPYDEDGIPHIEMLRKQR